MAQDGGPASRTTWRTPVRIALQAAFPIAGILVVGHALLASIGGNIRPAEFVLGIVLIALTFSARLVQGR